MYKLGLLFVVQIVTWFILDAES